MVQESSATPAWTRRPPAVFPGQQRPICSSTAAVNRSKSLEKAVIQGDANLEGTTMSKQQNLVANTKLGEAVGSGDFTIFDQVCAPRVVDHDPAPDQGAGPEGFKEFFAVMRAAFPDLNV